MFSYASALVELGYFEAIDMNFLIVGHTHHSSIDQYFSVLSKAIKSAEFIGSPISLQALCIQAHKDRSRPSVNRQLDVCYNLVDAMKPYIKQQENKILSSTTLVFISTAREQVYYVLQTILFARKVVTD